MPRFITFTKRPAPPTVEQVYAIVQQLSPKQRAKVIAQLARSLDNEMDAAALRVHAAMEADGIFITEADIDAEVQVVRAEQYAASLKG